MQVDADRDAERRDAADEVAHLARHADADVSATAISSAPALANRAASSATRPGSTAPSNGQPNATPIVTVARMPSAAARSTIRSPAATPSSTDAPALRRSNSSVAANAKCTSSSPLEQPVVAALVQRKPGVDDALAALIAATTSSAPAICGTGFGLTKLTASMRGTPAAASRSTSSARTPGASVTGRL